MFSDIDHPNVTLLDWQAFKASETARQCLIAEVVERTNATVFRSGSYPWHVKSRLPVMHYCVRQVITMECIAPATGAK